MKIREKQVRIVAVLGMHRSGTSAITRGLQVMGVSLGEKLMPPSAGNNEKGFFEDIDINNLNIDALKTIGSEWYKLSPIEVNEVQQLRSQGYMLRAVGLLKAKTEFQQVFAFKDPRVAKLLPFWNEVVDFLQFDIGYVIALRNPLSIVKSLEKRDKIAPVQSYLLWLGHILESLRGSVGKPRVLVDYDHLMQSPDMELSRIAGALGLTINQLELSAYKSDFLDAALRHTVYDPNDLVLDTDCPPLVREVFVTLLEVVSGKRNIEDSSFSEDVARWNIEFDRLKSILSLADKQFSEIVHLRQAVAEFDANAQNLKTTIHESNERILDLQRTVNDVRSNFLGLQHAVQERDNKVLSLQQGVHERGEELLELQRAVHERDLQVSTLQQALDVRDEKVLELQRAVHDRDQNELALEISVREQAVEALRIQQAVHERDESILKLQQRIQELEGKTVLLQQAVQEGDERVLSLRYAAEERNGQIIRLNQALSDYENKIKAMEHSYSWRITRPLAQAFGRSSKIGTILRRTAKLMWWTATFQLHRNIRYWLATRQVHGDKQPHFSPPNDDYCFAVPFGYSETQGIPAPSIAVICHMFYPDLLGEFKSYLENIPFEFDLFITTDSTEKKNIIEAGLADWQHGKVEIRITENRGRDIAPKLISCRDIYDRYEFFLHIHSKKSPHWDALVNWREYLLGNLLGSKEIVKSIFDAFDSDPKLGIIAPEHYAAVRGSIGWGWNFDNAKKFANRFGLDLDQNAKIDFPSGSMFWGRSAAITPLLKIGLTAKDFPKEGGQIDGTLGHVIERLYFFACEKAGYRWIKIGRPELVSGTERVLHIDEPASLRLFIGWTQYDLLHSIDSGLYSSLKDSPDATDSLSEDVSQLDPRSSTFNTQDMSLKKYLKKYRDCFVNQENSQDFDESFYLAAHPDVAAALSRGEIRSGYDHFRSVGRVEGRIYSDGQIDRDFNVPSYWPGGFVAPVDRLPLRKSTDLSNLPQSKNPLMLVMLSHLQSDLFFAGYSEFFKDYGPVFELFDRVVIAVEHHEYEKGLAERYLSTVEVINLEDILTIKFKPDLVVCFNAHLTCLAHQMLPENLDRIVYYCQDFEGGFFPYGADYIVGERAVACSKNLVVSTVLLRNFFEENSLIDNQNIFVTKPKIEVLDVSPKKNNKIFFYYRPEYFHKRNLPETLMEAMRHFCDRHTGYEIYMVGSVATAYSFKQNGTQVYVINKLPKERYVELISSCDVVVSMIYAAHPGVIAFQAAASGIPTVTNVFKNRDSFRLDQISSNIVPYDPVRDSLVDAIERALTMPKGVRSFKEELYSGPTEGSLVEFHKKILNTTSESTRLS